MLKLVVLLSAFVAITSAVGTVYVDNACPFTVYLQSFPNNGAPAGPLRTLAHNTINAYNELELGPDSFSGSNAIKIDTQPNIGAPVIFTYHLTGTDPNNGLDYYALSTIFGDPFISQGFQALSGGGGFSIVCHPRTGGNCPNTYNPQNTNGNGAVFTQPNSGNFAIQLCKSDGTYVFPPA